MVRGAALIVSLVLSIAASAYAAPGDTTLVNRSVMGSGDAWGDAFATSVSGDGRYVVFESADERYARYDGNFASDVFIRDTVAGTTHLPYDWIGDGSSGDAAISDDGAWVAFVSRVDGLDDAGEGDDDRDIDLFLSRWKDTDVTQINLEVDGSYVWRPVDPAISADGGRVVYRTTHGSVYLYERATDSGRMLVASGNESRECVEPDISPDGRFVAYVCTKGRDGGPSGVYRLDLTTGQELLVNAQPHATQSTAPPPSVSRDGRFVSFGTDQASVTPADTTTDYDVFVRDIAAGRSELVTPDLASPEIRGGYASVLSDDGRHVGLHTIASRDVCCDLAAVYDRERGTYEIVSRADGAEGRTAPGELASTGLSADGRFAVFNSRDNALDAQWKGGGWTAYVREAGATAPAAQAARPATTPPPGPAPSPVGALARTTAAPGSTVASRPLRLVVPRQARVGRTRRVSVSLVSGSRETLTGRLRLRAGRKAVASAPVRLAPGARRSVRVTLSRSAYRRLRRAGTLRVTVSASLRDRSGRTYTVSAPLVLRPARR